MYSNKLMETEMTVFITKNGINDWFVASSKENSLIICNEEIEDYKYVIEGNMETIMDDRSKQDESIVKNTTAIINYTKKELELTCLKKVIINCAGTPQAKIMSGLIRTKWMSLINELLECLEECVDGDTGMKEDKLLADSDTLMESVKHLDWFIENGCLPRWDNMGIGKDVKEICLQTLHRYAVTHSEATGREEAMKRLKMLYGVDITYKKTA
tara:strand:- start:47 stop:685 length:639 start_codon:yes stop_codon:yes gene_type:complete